MKFLLITCMYSYMIISSIIFCLYVFFLSMSLCLYHFFTIINLYPNICVSLYTFLSSNRSLSLSIYLSIYLYLSISLYLPSSPLALTNLKVKELEVKLHIINNKTCNHSLQFLQYLFDLSANISQLLSSN